MTPPELIRSLKNMSSTRILPIFIRLANKFVKLPNSQHDILFDQRQIHVSDFIADECDR